VISFRYHLVSIIAVFLALAVGIVVGTTALNGPVTTDLRHQVNSLKGDRSTLSNQVKSLQGQVDDAGQFASTFGSQLVAGKLKGKSVLIIGLPGVASGMEDGIAAQISAAGAQITGRLNLAHDYVAQSASKQLRPNSLNFFGTNYRKFMVSLLKAWFGDAATKDNEFGFNFLPKPASNASWMSIYDQALRGKMEGVMLSGMTATSIGPDSNQVLQALSNLKWLCVMDPLPTTSSEFWNATSPCTRSCTIVAPCCGFLKRSTGGTPGRGSLRPRQRPS